jgi:hypothetical protein
MIDAVGQVLGLILPRWFSSPATHRLSSLFHTIVPWMLITHDYILPLVPWFLRLVVPQPDRTEMGVPDNGPVIVGVTWMLTILSGGFLALRFYAKLSRKQGLWWDDHILTFSWVSLLYVLP